MSLGSTTFEIYSLSLCSGPLPVLSEEFIKVGNGHTLILRHAIVRDYAGDGSGGSLLWLEVRHATSRNGAGNGFGDSFLCSSMTIKIIILL